MIPSVSQLRKKRAKFVEKIDSRFGEEPFAAVGKNYEKLVDLVLRYVSIPGEYSTGIDDIGDGSCIDEIREHTAHKARRTQAVHNLLTNYVGDTLGIWERRKMAVEVTGQIDYIREGLVNVGGWTGQEPGRCLLYVNDVIRVKTRRGRRYQVEFDAYYGSAAGSRWTCLLSGGYLQSIMRDIGCGRFDKHYDEDISGTWFIALLSRDKEGQLVMDKIEATGSHKSYNRKLGRGRGMECGCEESPLKGSPCRPCPFSRAMCPRSRYAQAFLTKKQCVNGHEGLFRKDTEDEHCFACLQKGDFSDRNPEHG